MNVYILTDLEGISGVESIDCMDRGGEAYQKACLALAAELNCAAEECRACGAENVYYMDGHGGGKNITEDMVHPWLIKTDIPTWECLMQEGKIDCMIEIGAHARAGTVGGFLDHTMNSKSWFSYRINGREFSELSMHAVLCASYGVPVVMCSGDETACAQAKEYIPDIFTAPVKNASCRNACRTYPDAHDIIRRTVRDALAHYKEIAPFTVEYPLDISLTYYRTDMCEEALAACREKTNVRMPVPCVKP